MGATKGAKLEIQLVGVHNIKIERDLQSRVEINRDYIREFSEAILRGDVFPAVDVFWDGKKYWLADGFHRVEAHRKAGIVDVRCTIHYGTRREALIYSAGANQKFSIPRSSEDKARAAYMLFEDSEWSGKSPSQIGAHIGVSGQTVRRMRIAFCSERGIDLPEAFTDALGRYKSSTAPSNEARLPTIRRHKNPSGRLGQYRIAHKGKIYYLGHDEQGAIAKRDTIVGSYGVENKRRTSRIQKSNVLIAHFVSLGVAVVPTGNPQTYGLGKGLIASGFIMIPAEIRSPSDVCVAIGQVVLSRAKHLPEGRLVILCYDPLDCEAIDVAKSIGIEFMTPEEVADRIVSERSSSS